MEVELPVSVSLVNFEYEDDGPDCDLGMNCDYPLCDTPLCRLYVDPMGLS